MPFEDLGLSENILRAIKDVGYTEPTPIQAQAIPIVLMARDLVGLAQTGTGKTASFTLPMLEILSGGRAKARMPRSLILTPTRELAAQIAENFDTYGKYSKLTKALLVGGSSMEQQINALERGVDVLIATPGRLIDLFERGKILMSDIKILVIDEADRMLDMGFIPDIEKIASKLPPMRQTLLFSATMPNEIKKLTQKFLRNPKEVTVAAISSTAERVEQFVLWTNPKSKYDALDKLIQKEDVQHAIIFCNRKKDVDLLARWLERERGYSAKPMHGDMEQKYRTQTLADFKERKIKILVCSDVAARGIDIDDLSHVFNFDVPFNPEDYVHRIGRTARAGKTGRAWMLATRNEADQVEAIEKIIKKKIPEGSGSGSSGGDERKSEPKREPARDDNRGRQDNRKPKPQGAEKPRQQQQQPKAAPHRPIQQGEGRESFSPRPAPEDRDDDARTQGFGENIPGFFGNNGKSS